MRVNVTEDTTLEEAGIIEGMKIHLQDEIKISKKSKFTTHYFLNEVGCSP